MLHLAHDGLLVEAVLDDDFFHCVFDVGISEVAHSVHERVPSYNSVSGVPVPS